MYFILKTKYILECSVCIYQLKYAATIVIVAVYMYKYTSGNIAPCIVIANIVWQYKLGFLFVFFDYFNLIISA